MTTFKIVRICLYIDTCTLQVKKKSNSICQINFQLKFLSNFWYKNSYTQLVFTKIAKIAKFRPSYFFNEFEIDKNDDLILFILSIRILSLHFIIAVFQLYYLT